MLEHMMFMGTKNMKSGEFSEIVSKMGGRENAFTSSDYTAYYQIIGKQHLAEVMRMESDRMRNIIITEEEFQRERDVVTEERRWRTEDKPAGKLYEQFKAAAFMNSPSHHPIIGWMSDIKNYTVEDLRAWYKRWYAPNNAILVVVGDVDPDEVIKLAKQTYGQYKAQEIVQAKPQIEVQQEGERRITLKEATETPQVLMGFHVPTLVTAKDEKERREVYALEVLSSVLDGGSSARLPKNLVRKAQTLAGVGAGYDGTDRLKTLFLFEATPSAGVTPQQAEEAIWKEIEKVKSELVSEQELNRVLAQSESQYIYHQDSIQSQAMVLGSLVTVGLSVDTLENWIDEIRKVTPEEVRQVAQKYLLRDKLTIATLLPDGKKNKTSNTKSYGGRH